MRRARAPERRVRVYQDSRRLSLAVAGRFAAAAAAAVRERGRFVVALSGGRTPRELYRSLAGELRDIVAWRNVHFFWSDERYVPPGDPESNFRLARETLLDPLALPPENVHPPSTELPDPDEAAAAYEREVLSFFEPEPPRFDWVLLGLGRDGHVASLFPRANALDERRRLVVATDDGPYPRPTRLTMTLVLVNQAREIHFLVTGEDKREAVANALAADGSDSPARRVRPAEGKVTWWLDRKAAGEVAPAGRGKPRGRGGTGARGASN